MEVEDVRREGLTTGWTLEEERELTISDGVFGEVVVDSESVVTEVTRKLHKGGTGERAHKLS
jgi:hypothetical protein